MVLGAAVVAQVAQLGALAPLVLAGLLVAGNVAVLRWRGTRRTARAAVEPRWFAGPLAASWLVATLLPMHQFSHRPITASGPSIGTESALELVAFAGIGVLALAVIRTLEPTLARAQPPAVLFPYPVWLVVTALWSATAPYAVVRGLQLVVVAFLGWATVALGRADAAALDLLVATVLRWFVRVTMVLVPLGIAFGPLWVNASEANLDRFTWAGAHPLAAGVILAAALVIAVTAPAGVLRVPRWARIVMVVTFVGALVPNHSRQSWLALVVIYVVALGLQGRLTPLVRWIGAPLLGAAAVAGMMFRGDELLGYVLRDNDTSELGSGNGRLQLWGIGFRALDTAFDWLCGLGFGVTRTLFADEVSWARTAHNSLLAVLVSAGLVGVVLFLAVVTRAVLDLLRSRLWATADTGLALTLLLLLIVLNGAASDNLAVPNFGSSLLYLIAAVTIVRATVTSIADQAAPARTTWTAHR